ncbi:FAD-binding oxidoreductase, partial [Geobacillus sp. MMMUD3]|nr:FAD-binding oxidoreductase [Geobacillus sp. MMMUD3]
MSAPSSASAEALVAELSAAGVGDVTGETADRAAYSSDASLFRLVPQAVVFPCGEDDVAAALSVARRLG